MFKPLKILLLVGWLFIFLTGVGQDTEIHYQDENYFFPYHLHNASLKWELPNKLEEISGLSYSKDDRLACVQDEKGNIYIFNSNTGHVEQKIDFGDDGDYEGIEVIGEHAWVMNSKGTLFLVKNYLNEDALSVEKYNTKFTGKNDTEGLGYDPISQKLLIACKGHPFVDDKHGKEFKAVYFFDTEAKKIDSEPFLLIEMDSIKYYKNYNTMTRLGVELLAYFDDSKGDLSFQPSAIAVHPLRGNIYILAAVGNLLIVYSREGKMMAMVRLKSKNHPQPEGICFGPDGTLYIANEGDGGHGTIQAYKMIQ
jgi:uncharacterized protein YjiK